MSFYYLLPDAQSDTSGGSDIVIPHHLWKPYREMLEAQAEAYKKGKRKTPPRTIHKEEKILVEKAKETIREVIKEVPVFPNLTGILSAIAEIDAYNKVLEARIQDIEARGREKEKKMRQAALAAQEQQLLLQRLEELRRIQKELQDKEDAEFLFAIII